MTTPASKNPDVFIAMTARASCTQSITESAGDGSASDGWVVGGGVKALDSPAYDDDPWIKAVREEFVADGIDWKTLPTSLTGARFAWDIEQALRIAGALDGGLTRANFIVVLRAFEMSAPFLLPGAKFNMNGNSSSMSSPGYGTPLRRAR